MFMSKDVFHNLKKPQTQRVIITTTTADTNCPSVVNRTETSFGLKTAEHTTQMHLRKIELDALFVLQSFSIHATPAAAAVKYEVLFKQWNKLLLTVKTHARHTYTYAWLMSHCCKQEKQFKNRK